MATVNSSPLSKSAPAELATGEAADSGEFDAGRLIQMCHKKVGDSVTQQKTCTERSIAHICTEEGDNT